jgi:hypothetical protein
MTKNRCIASSLIAAAVLTVGCTVQVEPVHPVVEAPVILTDPVPPPPVIEQYYFWGGHYYYWHPDRHAYVIYNGHPAPERIVTVRELPHRR